ncbi:AMP-binding protein [Acidianus sp. RZ1]|uniref:AMP-binding protein n=1 Tax=Acidianus sp. RZ1 TaxID=1540082 RepID=UPI001492217E|nr:AMP-binding protein [Acidianus sp. RZ1]NON63293.1 AMP-binding protein [Acidianus sp. RZ1]
MFDIRVLGNTYEEIKKNFIWPNDFDFVKQVNQNEGVALIFEGKQFTYQELRERSNAIEKFLKEIGVKGGDVVAGMLPQSPELVYSLLGTYKASAIFLSMSTLFGIDSIAYRVTHSNAKIIFADEDSLKEIKETGLKVITVSNGEGADYDFTSIGRETKSEYHGSKLDQPTHLFYTSGTTGQPKGVLLPRSWILGHLPAWQIAFDLAPRKGDVFITPSEWAWIGGLGDLLLPSLYYGTIVVVYSRKGRLNVNDLIDTMEENRVSGAFLVPTAIRIMKQLESEVRKRNLKIRAIMSGGEKVDPELISWVKNIMNADLNHIYGQTEVNLVICNSPVIMKVKPDFTGPECPGHRVSIVDGKGNELPPNQVGEIAVKTPDPSALLEYYRNEKATKEKIVNGWILTGDMGFMDEEGYIKFVGRKDDIIKSSAYRLSPLEIEEVIAKHPAVNQVAVVGIEDPLRGTIIAAFIVLKEGYEPNQRLEDDIKNFVKQRLAVYAYPRIIKFVKELPTTITGKIRRTDLREQLKKEIQKS